MSEAWKPFSGSYLVSVTMRKNLGQQLDHLLKAVGIRRPARKYRQTHGDPCARYEALLSPYMDGMLDERKTALVEGHLNACASCRASVAATRLISHTLGEKAAPAFTPDMSARLCLALAAERAKANRRMPIFTGPRVAALGMACFAAAAVIVMTHAKHNVKPSGQSTPVYAANSNMPAARPITPESPALAVPARATPRAPGSNVATNNAPTNQPAYLNDSAGETSGAWGSTYQPTPVSTVIKPRAAGLNATPRPLNVPLVIPNEPLKEARSRVNTPDETPSENITPKAPAPMSPATTNNSGQQNIASIPPAPSSPATPAGNEVAMLPPSHPAPSAEPAPAPVAHRLGDMLHLGNEVGSTKLAVNVAGLGGSESGTVSMVESSFH